jgi:hypothetical protein
MRFAPRRRERIIGSAWRALRQTKPRRSFNAISYPDEPGLREPDSLHFFRIFKEQPKQTYCPARAARWALSFPVSGASGGANRDRTGDLLLAKQALSQLSYGPEKQGQTTFFVGYAAGKTWSVPVFHCFSAGGSGWT